MGGLEKKSCVRCVITHRAKVTILIKVQMIYPSTNLLHEVIPLISSSRVYCLPQPTVPYINKILTHHVGPIVKISRRQPHLHGLSNPLSVESVVRAPQAGMCSALRLNERRRLDLLTTGCPGDKIPAILSLSDQIRRNWCCPRSRSYRPSVNCTKIHQTIFGNSHEDRANGTQA